MSGTGTDCICDIGGLDPLVAPWDLGRRESQVPTWALRHPGCEALLDDLAARKCAAALSVPVRGTLGVLLLAKKEGHLAELGPVIMRVQQAGLHIDSGVLGALRRLAGEDR